MRNFIDFLRLPYRHLKFDKKLGGSSTECVREFSRGRVECVIVSTRMCHINCENYNFVQRPHFFKFQTENDKENVGINNIILPCLAKVGNNFFSHDQADFETWLTSLNKNALYKSLQEAHTAVHL